MLKRNDWSEDVKNAVNSLISEYGVNSAEYSADSYAVFDFDNTSAIFDIEEQLAVYQLQTMAFEIKPESMKSVLLTDISQPDRDISDYGYICGSYSDLTDDIAAAYAYLWEKYGPFDGNGIESTAMLSDPYWLEFAAKMRAMYSLVCDTESDDVAYPWMLYWFTGMTEQQVYDLAVKCLEKYSKLETTMVTWTSPESIPSKTGSVSISWTSGVSVTENIKELWRVLDENGIDVWVCSASGTGAITAAIDYFGLHKYCTGMLAMTNKKDGDGKYIPGYDYTGCGYYADDSGWRLMSRSEGVQTQSEGKVTAILNAISPDYNGHGPIAGFMDSTGDFNFCTEFSDLKLVVCFNRANRKVTDGGGLVAIAAMLQKNSGIDLEAANASGDTLYVLQGRDENGLRTFRSSNMTVRLEENTEKLFANADNELLYKHLISRGMSLKEFFNSCSIIHSENDSSLGFKFGFLTEYSGYHSK